MTEKKTDKTDSNIRSQMRKGILEYCVLLLLNRQRAYPSDIINGLSEANLIVVEGTLYTLLNRLRKEGKLSYEWEESPKGPPRKYYFITETGKETLKEMSEAWDEIVENVNHFRNMPPEPGPIIEEEVFIADSSISLDKS
ncbi:MAG: PadR family transcriptional regulator [Muribaculaceae bacterium]|nr:PadR family transcriptional regulator [Muribaculaceae bacterium]